MFHRGVVKNKLARVRSLSQEAMLFFIQDRLLSTLTVDANRVTHLFLLNQLSSFVKLTKLL